MRDWSTDIILTYSLNLHKKEETTVEACLIHIVLLQSLKKTELIKAASPILENKYVLSGKGLVSAQTMYWRIM